VVASLSFFEIWPDAHPLMRTPINAIAPPTASVSAVGLAKIR